MTLEELARTAYFRTERVPKDYQPELVVTRSYAQKHYPGIVTNGIFARRPADHLLLASAAGIRRIDRGR